ncbi:hypothetical protein ACLB2K_062389 [Fragaria x ananassa]
MSNALRTRHQQQWVLSESLDFLSWLPAKSLLRFRCICKTWQAMISEPYFIRQHLSRIDTKSNSSYSLLVKEISICRSIGCGEIFKCSTPSTELDFPLLDPLYEFYFIDIIGSCNGLVCLLLDFITTTIMLWNPCTRESKVLPQPPIENLPKFFGFGYDSTTDDYKVIVGSFPPTSGYEYVVAAFTLKSDSWRKLQSLNQNVRVVGHGCFVNEALHWILTSERDEDGRVTAYKLVSFNLAEEKFHEIASPYSPNSIDARNLTRVGNFRNSLALYCQPFSFIGSVCFRMWVLKEYGVEKSWTEVMKIPSEILPRHCCHCLKPLCISEDGVLLIEVFSDLDDSGFLMLYNPKEKTFKDVTKNCVSKTITYVETLVSP